MENDNVDRDSKVRRVRNWALALVLCGLVVLFFVMTIVRLGIRFGH